MAEMLVEIFMLHVVTGAILMVAASPGILAGWLVWRLVRK